MSSARSPLLPVVAIHGAGGSRAHWDDVVSALGAPSWLHVLDLPGRGADRTAAPIDDVDAMLDAVLASTTPRFSVPPAVFDAIASDWDAFVLGFAAFVFARSAPEEMRARATDVLRDVGPRTLDADLRTALSHDGRDALATLAAPALVLVGDRDRLTPPSGAEAIARGMRDATLQVLEGAGHMLTYERSAEIAEAISAMRARV